MATADVGSPGSKPAEPAAASADAPSPDPLREWARQRITARRDLYTNLISYVVINAFLIGAWFVTGAGYFWPGWVLATWGAGLVLHAWTVLRLRPITEADIDTELRRR